jgi:hypothetical protein
VNWTPRESSRTWRGVSVSSDGVYQTAVVRNGLIYTSTTGTNNVATNSYIFNLDNGSTFFLTGTAPTANYSINFVVNQDISKNYLVNVINNTTRANTYCNAVSINSVAVSSANFMYTTLPGSIDLSGSLVTTQEFNIHYNITSSAWMVDTNINKYQV